MKRLLSGIQPSGQITLGNYIGAIKQFVKLQNELNDIEFFVMVVDLHAITVPQEKQKLRKNIKELAALYLACGLNKDKVTLFIQSEVKEHLILSYIMECTSYIGELERMTQYKDKKQKQIEGIRTSLLTYPCLMAADILLYDIDLVPIGADQKQHVELTRDIAERFNSHYGETFKIPEPYFPKTGARIKSLTEPTKKMSKSTDNLKSAIFILDDINQAKNKIKSAVTDSDTVIRFDEKNKPGISNLLTIYSSLTDIPIKNLEESYKNKSYKEFKEDLANIVGDELKRIQDKYNEIIASKELDEILDNGARKASIIAARKIDKVFNKIGLGRKK